MSSLPIRHFSTLMVRFAGQIPTMDNREELLDALNDFSRKQSKEIPPLLDQFLKQVAKTGETLFPWTLLKALFIAKLEQVMGDFSEESVSDQIPSCPNVENARFEVYRDRIMEAVHRFHGAPFTIQRLCELLTDPKRHYKRCDKFMRGLEKNVLVVSTVDPFGRKVVSESKNLVNGMDGNSSGEETLPTTSFSAGTPPVPSWTSGTSATWPLNADVISPSTSPLLEVCDLPDPKESSSVTPTSSESSTSSPVNGHDGNTSADDVEVTTDSSSAVTSTHSSESSNTALSVVTAVTNMEETVDSSDQAHQQVAAEEMVGVEEEAATSTAISQEAAGVVEETVVETPPVAAEVLKETSETAVGSSEATPTASGDWLANISDKVVETASSSSESQGNSHVDDTPAAEASSPSLSHVSSDCPSADISVKQDTDSTEAETASGEMGREERDLGKEVTDEKQGGSDSACKMNVGEGEDSDSGVVDPVTADTGTNDTCASSTKDSAEDKQSSPSPVSAEPQALPSASDSCTEVSQPSSSSETSDTTPSGATPVADTTTTTAASSVTSSEADKMEESTAANSESADVGSADSSSSVPQAAASSESNSIGTSSIESTEVQQDTSSTDSSQAEPMEQD